MDDELLERLLDAAENRGTIDYDHPDSVQQFMDDLHGLQEHDDWNGQSIPSADTLTEEQQFDWIDFFDEYDLWDEVRDEWEDYELAA